MKTAIDPMQRAHAAPRCSATSKRSGHACRSPALRGKGVCRMHGARGGGPAGVENGRYIHGRFTCEEIGRRQALHQLIRASIKLVRSCALAEAQ